jgi:hypothetical protein
MQLYASLCCHNLLPAISYSGLFQPFFVVNNKIAFNFLSNLLDKNKHKRIYPKTFFIGDKWTGDEQKCFFSFVFFMLNLALVLFRKAKCTYKVV